VVVVVEVVVVVVGAWQALPTQLVPAGQQTPRPVVGSSSQAGRPVLAQTQSPLRQSWPLPHWKPQAPQLKSSVACDPVAIVQ